MLKDKPKYVKINQLIEYSKKSLETLEKWSDEKRLDFFKLEGKDEKIYELEETLERIKEIEEGKHPAEEAVQTSAQETEETVSAEEKSPVVKSNNGSSSSLLKKILFWKK